MIRILPTLLFLLSLSSAVAADPPPKLAVEAFEIENGMRFLLVRRPGAPMVATAWGVRVGSGDERPGITGISHLLEHLMFQGTTRIGTRNAGREGELMARQDEVWDRLLALRGRPSSPGRDAEMAGLQKQLDKLLADQKPLILLGELHRIYHEAGAVGINALTDRDYTVYFGQIPANKLELWFWMESDRLLAPVFREIYNEGQIVEEERRQRLDSTPLGPSLERIDAVIWEGHPYAWPTLGRTADLATITRAQTEAYFAASYRPERLTAALVGDFDPEQVKALARAYFGRLPRRGERSREANPAAVPARAAEQKITETCECAPQARVIYRTPAFGHPDTYALDVLAGLLSGRTGRLHRALVLGRGTAFAAFALHDAWRHGGQFSVSLEAKGGTSPQDLVPTWDEELKKLRDGPIPERELQKVKNQILTDSWRRLADPLALALSLATLDARGDWNQINRWPEAAQAVTAEDVRRVIDTYFRPQGRTVAIFQRVSGSRP